MGDRDPKIIFLTYMSICIFNMGDLKFMISSIQIKPFITRKLQGVS